MSYTVTPTFIYSRNFTRLNAELLSRDRIRAKARVLAAAGEQAKLAGGGVG
jgi:hypothetical protein